MELPSEIVVKLVTLEEEIQKIESRFSAISYSAKSMSEIVQIQDTLEYKIMLDAYQQMKDEHKKLSSYIGE